MKIYNQEHILFSKISALLISLTLVGFIYAISSLVSLAVITFPINYLIIYRLFSRKTIRRLEIIKTPFPKIWRNILERRVAFYRQLGKEEKRQFEQNVQVFLDEQQISGVGNVVVDDEIRLMVAAGAVTLVFYRPEWEFRSFREILIYEDAFDQETFEVANDKNILGLVGTQMPVILSKKHLKEGFRHGGDGFNVAYHEFAHIIDLHDVGTQNNPLHGIFAQALILSEMKKIRGGQSVLRNYGATNEAEFFAVATEFFYERPAILYAHHRDLYNILRIVYNYDPLLKTNPVIST